MKIIVIGNGKVGYAISRQLAHEGHDVSVIDHSIDVVNGVSNTLDVEVIQGEGANVEVLKLAKVDQADLVIAATSKDEVNIMSCLLSRKLGAARTIARVRNPEYVDSLSLIQEELGLTMSINPEKVAASEILRQLSIPSEIKLTKFAKGRVELAEVKVTEKSPLMGLTVNKLKSKFKTDVLLGVIRHDEEVIIPSGDTRIFENDKVSVAGSTDQIHKFLTAIGVSKTHPVKNVMIIGGGKLIYYLVQPLLDQGINVKIIEKSREHCLKLVEKYPRANIINGDGTDHELLMSESVDEVDALIALTDNDEENVIVSMFAKSKGVYHVMPKVNRVALEPILEQVGLNHYITPKYLTASQIVTYVRAMQNASGSNIESMTEIVSEKVEALEFKVASNCTFIGKPLKDLTLKKGILVGFITRNGVSTIATGLSSVEIGDSVVIISQQLGLKDLNDVVA